MMLHDALVSFPLLVIQDQDAPDLGGGGGVPPDGTGTGGGGGGGGGGGAGPLSDIMFIFVLLFVVIIAWSIFGQRREKKKREAMLQSIRKHDQVQTVGGIIGSVVELKGQTVVLKVDEASNTRMTFARSAIQQVLTDHAERKKEKEPDQEPAKEA